MININSKNVNEYINHFPENVQTTLHKIRKVVREFMPEAEEKMSYGIPTYKLNRNAIHFAAYEKHIGLYPGSSAIVDFADQLKDYETAKGMIRLQLDKPIPYDLITKIAVYCAERDKTL